MEKNSNPDVQTNSAFEAASSGQVNSAFEAASGSQVNSAFEPASNQQGASAFESSSGVGSAFESDEDSAQSKARSRTFGLVDNKGYRHTLWGEEILRNQGAMSIVSTAWLQEESSEQKVLIKRIQGDADPNKVVLFSNEALITCENGSRGRHLAHGKFMGKDSQGRSFLVMEYYEGNNLEKKIEAGVYETNPGRCKAVIRGILEGLVELHDQGIVHRDLKPANIIVRSDNGVPVLLDFGLACKTNLRDLNVSTIGTFGYAAPEQQDGAAEHTIAFSADVYSVGVIFLEMLTPGFSVLKAGENFAGKIDRNDPERRQKLKARLKSFRKILDGQIAKLEKNNAGAFKNFISKCLEWAPEKRFQSGQEALDQFMSVAAQFHSELDPELDAANRIVKGSMTDPRDEKTYKTIKIGSKIWLAENLGYKTPDSLCYDNDEEIANKYGRLYTLSDAKKACPPGWRLPSKKDIEELIAAAGGARVAGKNLKSASGWQANDGQSGNGVDALGFSALPAGGWQTDSEKPDDPEENGFFLIGEKFDFWYDSGMLELYNHSNCADIEPFHIDYVDDFYSVRCIKDESVKPAIQQPKQDISVGNSSEENKVPKKSKAPVVIGFLVILFCIVAAVVYSNKSDEDLSADNQTQVENVVEDSRDEDSSADNQAQIESVLKGSVMDPRDRNTYNTVKIGDQWWMAENLNYTITNSWCYENKFENCQKYGRLYTWNDAKTICPEGWHLPNDNEWEKLFEAVGGQSNAHKVLKSRTGWGSDHNGTDAFGFTALPAGYSDDGYFQLEGENAFFWSSTEINGDYANYMSYTDRALLLNTSKKIGMSVRCVKD